MRSNRALKLLSYILIPILILIICASVTYETGKKYFDEEEYFKSSEFASDYFSVLISAKSDLIYEYDYYLEKNDGENRILYTEYNNLDLKNNYYLLVYKNKAITNVNAKYDTIEKIKDFINQVQNSHKVEIVNGELSTDSEVLAKAGISRYQKNMTYYNTDDSGMRIYYNVDFYDVEFYGAYTEELSEESTRYQIMEIASIVKPFENEIYIILPVSAIMLIALITYLVIAIGYKKGVEGIDLNDFDKIPLEIVLCSAIIVIVIMLCCYIFIADINQKITDLTVSVIITAYFLIYYVLAITANTIIKRIKSKTFGDTCWLIRINRFIFRKLRNIWELINYSTNITVKVIVYIALAIIIPAIVYVVFYSTGLSMILCFAIFSFIVYRILKECVCMDKIDKKLKEMYDGNNSTKLKEEEFTNTLKKQVKYINDISNGFENAIDEKMKSERLKTELITNVSHDIKTPLTSIINYVDLLKHEEIKNEKAKEYINILNQKSQRLKKLIEDLVEASKVSTGNVKLSLESINICELIKQMIGEFDDRFKNNKLDVVMNVPNEGIYVKADNRYMYRVIENLFSNISKYALENSRVYVDIYDKGETVEIEIKNISKDKLNISVDELMQRFVRGDKSRNTEGSGLGISISKSLTELQNGKFNMEIDGDLFKVELEFTKIK